MRSLLLSASVSFISALLLTPICRDLFLRIGLVDRPDQQRKLHIRAVPRVGGIPLALAYLAPFLLFLVPGLGGAAQPPFSVSVRWALLSAGTVILGVGLVDDIWGLKPWQKLLGQSVAAALVCSAGVRIQGMFGRPMDAWFGVPLTLVWLVACTNAFNLIDGVDGLAAGAGVLATLTIVLSALLQGNHALAAATVPLAAALIGFLRYNFNPASIFLGDAGSLLIGFLLGFYAVLWSEKSTTVLGTAAPLMALAFPLLDTGIAVIRRLVRGRPIFAADRGHIHHRLLDQGLTPRRAVLLLYAFCGLAAVFALVQSLHERYAGLVVVIFCGLVWIGIQRLGYVEFGALTRLFADGMVRSTLTTNIHLIEFRTALEAATTAEECWQVVRRYYRRFGFSQITLRIAGRSYSDAGEAVAPGNSWMVLVPISLFEYAQLSRAGTTGLHPSALGAFADALGAGLKAKSAALATRVAQMSPPPVAPRPAAPPKLVRTAGGS